MEITREKHFTYITRLMPLLLLAYVAQIFLYLKLAPRHIAIDVSVFVGIGLVLVAAAFAFYDHFHKVKLHRHHLEAGLPLFNYREEVLYRHVQTFEIKANRHAFYNVTLHLRDGRELKLYYLDDVEELKHCLRNAS